MIKFEALIAVFRKRDFLAVVVAVSVYLRHVALRAYLHGTTLSHATSLRQAYDTNCIV